MFDFRYFADLILGAQEDCSITQQERNHFPHCEGKIGVRESDTVLLAHKYKRHIYSCGDVLLFQWMKLHWKDDSCYAKYGVDGSECSFRVYLSEFENFCPLVKGRTRPPPPNATKHFEPVRLSLHSLLRIQYSFCLCAVVNMLTVK